MMTRIRYLHTSYIFVCPIISLLFFSVSGNTS